MSRQPRFEVVRTAAGWHARYRAANGQIVWTTEVYKRRGKAHHAVDLLLGYPFEQRLAGFTEVREIDERSAS